MTEQPDGELVATAWHSKAFNPLQRYTVGTLRLHDGRLSFTTDAGEQFNAPVGELNDLTFGTGASMLKVTANGTKWRFVFARPAGAPAGAAAGGAVGIGASAVGAVSATKQILESRKVGKAFQAALEQR